MARRVHYRADLYPDSGMPQCREGVRRAETFALTINRDEVTCQKCRHWLVLLDEAHDLAAAHPEGSR